MCNGRVSCVCRRFLRPLLLTFHLSLAAAWASSERPPVCRSAPGRQASSGSLPSSQAREEGTWGGRWSTTPWPGSAGPTPPRSCLWSSRGSSRKHAAAARPLPLIPTRATFCAAHVAFPATRTLFARPVWPFPLPVRPPRTRAQFFALASGCGARARPFPPRRLCVWPPPPAAVPGAAGRRRPPARKGAGPSPPPPGSSPGFPQRTVGGVGEGPVRPLCSRQPGAPCLAIF